MTSQGRPVGLIIAGVAVLAAGLLLLFIMKSGDDDAAAGAPSPATSVPGTAPVMRDRPRPTPDRPNAPQVATVERTTRPADGSDSPGYTETVINGVRVRDHRKDKTKPIEVTTGGRPPDARRIQQSLTGDISNRILPVVRDCGAGVPPEARGPKPRAEMEVVIAIRNKQVHVTKATVQLTDVVGASLEPTRQCIEQKLVGFTLPAGDEPDVEDYTLTLSYGVL
jgi:hypothetical protein